MVALYHRDHDYGKRSLPPLLSLYATIEAEADHVCRGVTSRQYTSGGVPEVP